VVFSKRSRQCHSHATETDWLMLTLYGHIKTAEQRGLAIRWLVHWPLMSGLLYLVQRAGTSAGCGHAQSPPPNVTAMHPSTAIVPTSYYSMWQYNFPVVVWHWLGDRDCTAQYCCLPCNYWLSSILSFLSVLCSFCTVPLQCLWHDSVTLVSTLLLIYLLL